MSKNLKERN